MQLGHPRSIGRHALTREEHRRLIVDGVRRLTALDAPLLALDVPTCPPWKVWELLHHLGAIYLHVAELVVRRPASGPEVHRALGPQPGPEVPVLPWFARAASRLLATLGGAASDEYVWSWGEDRTAGFWERRLAQETTLHLWDVGMATGRAAPIGATVCADGVDEFLVAFVPMLRGRSSVQIDWPCEYRFVACDVALAWSVTLSEQRTVTGSEHPDAASPPGAVEVRGSATDLLLALWGRTGGEALQAHGDAGLRRWMRLVGCP